MWYGEGLDGERRRGGSKDSGVCRVGRRGVRFTNKDMTSSELELGRWRIKRWRTRDFGGKS